MVMDRVKYFSEVWDNIERVMNEWITRSKEIHEIREIHINREHNEGGYMCVNAYIHYIASYKPKDIAKAIGKLNK